MDFVNSKIAARLGVSELYRSVQMVWRGSGKFTFLVLGLGVFQAMLPLASLY